VLVPDRADAPVSEITERFLRAIVAHVPLDRLEELHLFSPLKQGGVETGIAVVAARVPLPPAPVEPALELPLVDLGPSADATGVADVVAEEIGADVEDTALPIGRDDDAVADAVDDSPYADAEHHVGPLASDETLLVDDTIHADATGVVIGDVIADEAADDEPLADVIVPGAVAVPIERHTVYTARYRLVQKGPERGKWEADVVAEADAPLITVEMVVRGVQRRAGEESEILRYSAKQIAKALRLEWPTPTA
jgi:hypothetical protein